MINKTLLIVLAAVIIVGGGAFYGGMKYAQSRAPQGRFSQTDFQNLSPEERQQRFQQLGQNGGRMRQAGAEFTTGEIISKDDKSITVKLPGGGSKIVFYSDTTEVGKFVNGALNDLEADRTVSMNGKTNSDGSMTAQSIQIRQLAPNQPQE